MASRERLKDIFEIQSSYEEDDNAERFVEKAKFKLEEMQKFHKLCETSGFPSEKATAQLKTMLAHEHFKNENQLLQLKRLLIVLGKWK